MHLRRCSRPEMANAVRDLSRFNTNSSEEHIARCIAAMFSSEPTLSVTEAELSSGIECVQDMLFAMRVLESMGLRVKKPMTVTIDNKGAVDYANNWSTGGWMRHSVIKLSFLRGGNHCCGRESIGRYAGGSVYQESRSPIVQATHCRLLWRRRLWLKRKGVSEITSAIDDVRGKRQYKVLETYTSEQSSQQQEKKRNRRSTLVVIILAVGKHLHIDTGDLQQCYRVGNIGLSLCCDG
jgi:hypothetical protein